MWLRSLALLAVLTSTAAAAAVPPPQDAPAACIDPVGAEGFSAQLAKGPKVVGTYTLPVGKTLVTPRLRLLATSHFMPTRVGASTGEWLPGLEVALLPDVTRDGPSYRNSVDQHGYDPLRIGTYRVTVKSATAKKVVALVEDLGCLEEYVHAPLAPAESKTFWVSTEGVRSYSFSTGHWYDQVARMYFAVSAGLAPDVQQAPGTTTPHGWIAAQAWENQGGLPSWDDRYLDKLTPGSVMETPAHRFEVLRVVLGKNTSVVDGRVVTTGGQPSISALIRVTRRAKELDKLMRNP
ncbi:MAG: hypothetical protein SFX73_18800 [Kofleriaceae bacterium]|nr:hypothetical protein [Kofleriaceae bacterium]